MQTGPPDVTGDAAPAWALLPTALGVTEPGNDEPLAVLAVGPAGASRREVVAALLDLAPELLVVPSGSYLVLADARVATRSAFVPGYRQPHLYGTDRVAAGPALARPPRRVELRLTQPLLRHFALVDTPDTGDLGVAGVRVLLDAVGRGGALIFVISADQVPDATEVDLLRRAARAGAAVLLVVTPGSGRSAGAAVTEEVTEAAAPTGPCPETPATGHGALLAAVPDLAPVSSIRFRPHDPGGLRRALVGWAAAEGLRRAGSRAPVTDEGGRRVPVLPDVGDWSTRLASQTRDRVHQLRQDLTLELAHIHLRLVQGILFGSGCAGLPRLFDDELHALSLAATARCDLAVHRILTDATTDVFGAVAEEAIRRRVAHAVRWGLTGPGGGRDLDRVLLVTSTAGVARLAGASAAHAAYAGAERDEVLPPVAVALSGGCYQAWRDRCGDGPAEARYWVQRALREVELELHREVVGRFEAARHSLHTVLADAVDDGILLA